MHSLSSPSQPRIPCWPGLLLGLAAIGLSVFAWLEEGQWHSLVAALSFAFWTYPWSQIQLSRKQPWWGMFSGGPLSPLESFCVYAGFGLMCLSLLLRWL